MQSYFVTISILVLLYELFVLTQAWIQGRKVGSNVAVKQSFIRGSVLMLIMAALLTVYQYIKLTFLPNISVWVEIGGLFVVVLFLAMKNEGYWAKRPMYFEKDDNGLVLTAVRTPLDLTRVTGVEVSGSRVEVELLGRPGRNLHIADDKVRKEIVRKLRTRARVNKGGK